MTRLEQSERETNRVIVLGQDGTEILLVPKGERHMLPWVEIPRWQRVAENLTAAAKSGWGEEVVCLFEPATEPLAGGVGGYQALQGLRSCGDPKVPTRWLPLSTLCPDMLTDAQDYAVIKQVITVCNKEIEGTSAGPFACLGWFCELRNWIESVIVPMGYQLTGEFQQLNASASFSLIRFETNGPALWFKAVGEPNQREFAITCALARFFPDYLPKIFGSRPDWNGWLTGEVEGKPLSEVEDRATWELVAGALARLQIQSIERSSQMLDAGARDLRLEALSKLVQPFMSVVTQLMERQTKIPPSILNREDLTELTDALFGSIEAMEATGIPDAVGHLDLNPGNIIVAENRTTFLDWAEAYAGNPLFSLQYLLQHARRALGGNPPVEAGLTKPYCAQWGGAVSATAMADALSFAPLLAVFAYAAGNDAWKQPDQLHERAAAGYLRSLARRMHREARQLADRKALCLR